MEFFQEIEKALTRRYGKTIWRPFMAANKEYQLVCDGDQIAVCISGGKDSMLLAKCMQELKKRSPLHFGLRFLCMDPGYTPENRRRIEENCALLGIPVEFFETDIFAAIDQMDCSPCYMCAKMRRGYLYRRAQQLGCNKIALGHHYDDAVETILISLIYGGQIQGMLPKLRSDNVPGMQLIRPLYKVREAQIIAWRDENHLQFLNCACKVTQRGEIRADGSSDSKRAEMKNLVRHLTTLNPDAAKNIFRSTHNVSLDSMIRWKHHGAEHSFLEDYE
ncbi:MAG: tRNA 2-thiocytidine biosynthesis protein TtcA [Clostridia bacterium]|nr:tRNA 2-thiocytidine biosynthesis protein TtcA [Clostridia bacterium]